MAANIKQNADNAAQTEKIARQSAKDAEISGEAVGRAVGAMRTIADKISHRAGNRPPDRPAGAQRRGGGRPRRRTWQGFCGRRLRSAQARRTQPGCRRRNQHTFGRNGQGRDPGRRHARQPLVPDIRKTAELVSEISAACREQDIGASQINEAIQQLDKVTQQNASASDQISSTSEALASRAEQLQESMAFFRLDTATAPIVRVRSAPPPRKAAATKPSRTAASGRSAPPPVQPNSVTHQQQRASGFALDLTNGGGDSEDGNFGRAA